MQEQKPGNCFKLLTDILQTQHPITLKHIVIPLKSSKDNSPVPMLKDSYIPYISIFALPTKITPRRYYYSHKDMCI